MKEILHQFDFVETYIFINTLLKICLAYIQGLAIKLIKKGYEYIPAQLKHGLFETF